MTVQSDYFDDLTKRAEGAPRSNANAVALLRATRPVVATKQPETAQDGQSGTRTPPGKPGAFEGDE